MIEPKEIQIEGKTFILSKFPATVGREIIANYPLTALPKIGDYKVNEAAMLKLMSCVSFKKDETTFITLSSKSLIDTFIANWETLAQLEIAMLEYNCSFFQNGKISGFFKDFAKNLQVLITKILTDSLAPLSQKEKPLSMNSEQSIA